MSNPFAAVETSLNAACLASLGNATATIGAASVAGVFDNGYASALGIAGNSPTFKAQTADLAAVAYGTAVTINAVAYVVREIKPDGTGLTTLALEEA